MVESEGEGDHSIAEWRAGHDRYWQSEGRTAWPTTPSWCGSGSASSTRSRAVHRVTAGDLGLPEGYRGALLGQGPRPVRGTRRSAAVRRVRPDLRLRLGAADHDPRQGRDPHPAEPVVVRPGRRHRRQPRAARRGPSSRRRSGDALPAAGDVPRRVRRPRLSHRIRPVRVPATGAVCGVDLPPGLVDGSRLPDADLHARHQGGDRGARRERDFDAVAETVGAADAEAAAPAHPGRLRAGRGDRPRAGDRAGRHQARVRPPAGGSGCADPARRRGAHPGLLPVLARGVLAARAGWGPGVLRQAVRPGLADLTGVRMGPPR